MAKFEISKDSAGKFRFHLKAPNGEIIAASQGYETKASAEKGMRRSRLTRPPTGPLHACSVSAGHSRVVPIQSNRSLRKLLGVKDEHHRARQVAGNREARVQRKHGSTGRQCRRGRESTPLTDPTETDVGRNPGTDPPAGHRTCCAALRGTQAKLRRRGNPGPRRERTANLELGGRAVLRRVSRQRLSCLWSGQYTVMASLMNCAACALFIPVASSSV